MPMNADGTFSRIWKFVDQFVLGAYVTRSDLDISADDLAVGINAALSSANQAVLYAGPKFDTIALMAAETTLKDGDHVVVFGGYNGADELFRIDTASAIAADGITVVALTGISGRAMSLRRNFNSVPEMLADLRGYDVLAVGEILRVGKRIYQVAASTATDQNDTTAGGVKLYDLQKRTAAAMSFWNGALAIGQMTPPIDGLIYERSSVTGTASATDDLGVDGFIPYGVPFGGHYGFSTTASAADNQVNIQRALDAQIGNILISPGTYNVAGNLNFPAGSGLVGSNGRSQRPTLKFSDGTTLAVLSRGHNDLGLNDIIIDVSAVTTDVCAMLINGGFRIRSSGVSLIGPGATDPAVGPVSYGIVLRSLYATAYTNDPVTAPLDAIQNSSNANTYGCYYNKFENYYVTGFSYARVYASKEDGTSSRVNQNMFSSSNIISNYHNSWMTGCGGGNVDVDTSLENATSHSAVVENQSSGTAPVMTGGEISSTGGDLYQGPGLLMNVANLTKPSPNTAGEVATHIRSTGGSTRLFGSRIGTFNDTAGEFEGTVLVAAGATVEIAARADLGINTAYDLYLHVSGSNRTDVADLSAAGSTGAVVVQRFIPGTTALIAEIDARFADIIAQISGGTAVTMTPTNLDNNFTPDLQWSTNGTNMQITNTSATDRTVAYRATRKV